MESGGGGKSTSDVHRRGDVVPFAAMVTMECANVGLNTLFKAATVQAGMSYHVFVVYAYGVAALILLPSPFFSFRSTVLPPLNFSIACKIFLLGLIGCTSQIMGYTGINYSSPTLASAISNLVPAFTFILALLFRMEKLALRSSSSQAKIIGAIVSISGALVVTLYKGPPIPIAFPDGPDPSPSVSVSPLHQPHHHYSTQSNWVLGGLFLTTEYILVPMWYIVQAQIMKEYPAELTVVFFYNLCVSVLAAIVGLISEPNSSAWRIRLDIALASIVCSGIFGSFLNNAVHTWVLRLRGPVFVAMFKPLSIAIAVAMGVVFLGDTLYLGRMQAHFENIQRIADTTTLPHSMLCLSNRVAEELDLLHLTERLIRGKDQPNTLTSSEKLELWERLKILSFARMVLSLWAMTLLSLYIRVQVNILGRHLYMDTARDLGSSHLLEEADLIDRNEQQQFLGSVDFLSNYGMPTLVSNMQAAASEVLKGKQLMDLYNTTVLHETIVQILDTFMSMGSPHHWVDYLMPGDARFYKLVAFSESDGRDLSDNTKFDQLMVETRAVLSSAEFGDIVDVSLKTTVNALMENITAQLGEVKLLSGMPLAKLLPRIAQVSPLLLEEPSKNRFVQIIQTVPEVELFFTLLYANMPTS